MPSTFQYAVKPKPPGPIKDPKGARSLGIYLVLGIAGLYAMFWWTAKLGDKQAGTMAIFLVLAGWGPLLREYYCCVVPCDICACFLA